MCHVFKTVDAVFATQCFHYYCGSCILKWLRVMAEVLDFKTTSRDSLWCVSAL